MAQIFSGISLLNFSQSQENMCYDSTELQDFIQLEF